MILSSILFPYISWRILIRWHRYLSDLSWYVFVSSLAFFQYFSVVKIFSSLWQNTKCFEVYDFFARNYCSSYIQCASILLRQGENLLPCFVWGDGACNKEIAGESSDVLLVAILVWCICCIGETIVLFVLHNNQKCVMIAWPTKNKIFPCLKFFVSVPYSSSCTQIIHLCYFFLYLIQKVSTVASKPVSDKCVFPNRVTIDAMENLLLLSHQWFCV